MNFIESLKYYPNVFSKISAYITIFYQKSHLNKYQKVMQEFKDRIEIQDEPINSSNINVCEPYFFLGMTHGEDDSQIVEINWRENDANSNYLENYIHNFYDVIRCPKNCEYCFSNPTKIYSNLPLPVNYWYTYPTIETLLKVL